MELTAEEQWKIYEEERARLAARKLIERKERERKQTKNCLGCLLLLVLVFIFVMGVSSLGGGGGSELRTKSTGGSVNTSIELDGKVSFDGTQFHITNQDRIPWRNCYFTLNSKYYYPAQPSAWEEGGRVTIKVGETLSIGAANFTLRDGTRFNPFSTKPQGLAAGCGSGFGYWGWE